MREGWGTLGEEELGETEGGLGEIKPVILLKSKKSIEPIEPVIKPVKPIKSVKPIKLPHL